MPQRQSSPDLIQTICQIADNLSDICAGVEPPLAEQAGAMNLRATLGQALLDLAQALDPCQQLNAATALLAALPQPSPVSDLTQRAVAREHLLSHLITQIRRSLDLATIWEQSARAIAEAFNADFCGILRHQEDGSVRMVHRYASAAVHSPAELDIDSRCASEVVPVWPARVLRSYDLTRASTPALTRASFLAMGLRAEMTAPIQIDWQKSWGRLAVGQATPRLWTDAEAELAQAVADQLAMAIAQAQLYQQLTERNADLDRRVHERTHALEQALRFEQLLARLANTIRSTLDEATILQVAVQELALTLDTDACQAGLLTTIQAGHITIRYEHLNPRLRTKAERQRLSHLGHTFSRASWPQGQWERITQGLPCVSADAPRLFVNARGKANRIATVLYPIQDDQGLIGLLSLLRGQACPSFQPEEVKLVGRVADQCAIAIRQARLYQQSRAQVGALIQLNHLKDDFLSNISHELRTPLSSMRLAIQMLNQPLPPERFSTYLKILETECQREIKLVEDLLDLQRLETGQQALRLGAVDLNEQLSLWLLPVRHSLDRCQRTFTLLLEPDPLPPLTTEISSLKRILFELLDNACKYTPEGGHIWLEIRGEGQAFTLRIGNTGDGIAPGELPHIFEKFRRAAGEKRWSTSGTGLGLALVQQLVHRLQGSIEVSSTPQCTLFSLNLPQLGGGSGLLHSARGPEAVAG